MSLKNRIKRSYFLWSFYQKISSLIKTERGGKIDNRGCIRIRKDIRGQNNIISVGVGSRIHNAQIVISGDNNRLVIGEKCIIGPDCSFRLEGNNITISIGNESTFTRNCNFTAQENNMSIEVGLDCMFSNSIIVRTSDSHPIYNIAGERINPPCSVKIGNHVWIAPQTTIMKGVSIGDNVIVGSMSLVTKDIESNSLCVGQPARIIKKDIRWTREELW